jgi:hypothetical protein
MNKLARGTRILSSLGSRVILTRQGVFEFFPTRRFFPRVEHWVKKHHKEALQQELESPRLLIVPTKPITGIQKKVFDLEHRLNALHRHSTIAHKLSTIFDYFLLNSRVYFNSTKPEQDGKKKYMCKVWYERDFFNPGKSIGTFVHYYGTRELHILDLNEKWVHLAPCQDSIYIRGVLTKNLAKYAMIVDRTFTLRLSWNTSKGKKYATFLLDAL